MYSYGETPESWVDLKNGTSINIHGLTVEELAEKLGM